MTFKPPDCPMCENTGRVLKPIYLANSAIYGAYDVEEVPCDCYHGQQYQIFLDRIRHPEYENPFLKMTNDEILQTLRESSDNQRAIDSEFDLET